MSLLPLAAAAPADVRDLTQAEHLVLFGFRATALGHGDCPVLHRTFHGLLGAEAEAALCNLLVFVRVIGAAGARRVRLQPPGCCAVSPDERLILGALAAAQASLAGEGERELTDHLADLLAQPPADPVLMAAQSVAAAFTLGGLHLRTTSAHAAPSTRTLH